MGPTCSARYPCSMLQWGRDRAVSEIWRRSFEGRRRRGFNGAETARSRKCRSSGHSRSRAPWLQWGRDRAVSEIWRRSFEGRRRRGFNGAETARSRKLGEVVLKRLGERGFNGAETARSRKSTAGRMGEVAGRASMGPRPRGLGNDELLGARQWDVALQWGRDRAVSEMAGGRGRRGGGGHASMGPRPRGLGNRLNRAGGKRRNEASMGPRPRGLGNSATDDTSDRWQDASMGPRPRGLGNWWSAASVPMARFASMGPRPRGLGNTFPHKRQKCSAWLQWGRDRAVSEIWRSLLWLYSYG